MLSGKSKRFTVCLVIWLIITLCLEVFLFNFKYWSSLNYSEEVPNCIMTDEGNSVELNSFKGSVHNLYIEPFAGMERSSNRTYVDIYVDGKLNSSQIVIINGILESKYLQVDAAEVNTIKIVFDNQINLFNFDDIKANVNRPFIFQPIRFFAILFFGACVIYAVCRKELWASPINFSNKEQLAVVTAITLPTLSLWIYIANISYYSLDFFMDTYVNRYVEGEYTWLVRSFLDGKASMPFNPPSYMKELADPYDFSQIKEAMSRTGEPVLMDYAYFDGQYYCYYGVVPAILFYLPFYLITGTALPNNYVVMIAAVGYVFASLYFLYALIMRYFKTASFGSFVVLSLIMINCSGFLHFVRNPNIYSVPFAYSYLFFVLGLSFWMNSFSNDSPKISKLILGSSCIALTLGCRPTFYIGLLFAFVIFAQEIRKGLFFRKSSIRNTLSVILPFAVIDSPIVFYNYIRFGSIFDFGASYNITVWNQHGNSLNMARFLPGIYLYLFKPFSFIPEFPFVDDADLSSFEDLFYVESYLGGLIFMIPVCCLLLIAPFLVKKMREYQVSLFVLGSILSAILLLAIDIQFAGISIRYISDFSVFFVIAVIISLLVLSKTSLYEKHAAVMNGVVIALLVISLISGYISMFSPGVWNRYEYASPVLFFFFKNVLFGIG